MKIILLAPIAHKGDYTHFVAHEFKDGKLSLIGANDKQHAKEIGMHYNKTSSKLPPYTLKIHFTYWRRRLEDNLSSVLEKLGKPGQYTCCFVDGWIASENLSITVLP